MNPLPYSIEYVSPNKDFFEKAGDCLLKGPRLAFGHRIQVIHSEQTAQALSFQKLPISKVTRVAAIILTALFLPITLIGYVCTRFSATYVENEIVVSNLVKKWLITKARDAAEKVGNLTQNSAATLADKARTLCSIAKAEKSVDPTRAEETLTEIGSIFMRIVQMMDDKAAQYHYSLPLVHSRAISGLCLIAEMQALVNPEEAKKTLTKTKETAKLIQDASLKAEALHNIAKVEATVDLNGAKVTANSIPTDPTDPCCKVRALCSIAEMQALVNPEEAMSILGRALDASDLVPEPLDKVRALCAIAVMQALVNFKEANSTLCRAWQASNLVPKSLDKERANADIEEAKRVIGSLAARDTSKIQDVNPDDADWTRCKIAQMEAPVDLKKATEIATSIPSTRSNRYRAEALHSIAKVEAKRNLKDAIAIVEMLDSYKEQAIGYAALAQSATRESSIALLGFLEGTTEKVDSLSSKRQRLS